MSTTNTNKTALKYSSRARKKEISLSSQRLHGRRISHRENAVLRLELPLFNIHCSLQKGERIDNALPHRPVRWFPDVLYKRTRQNKAFLRSPIQYPVQLMWPIYAEGPVDLPREILIYGEVKIPYQGLSSLWPFVSISGLMSTPNQRSFPYHPIVSIHTGCGTVN